MIGHPDETLEDVKAIADLSKAVLKEGENVIGRKAKVTAAVSTFIPKPHTPFQWLPCDTQEQIIAKQEVLRKELRKPGLKLSWSKPQETMFESALSRGDRKLSDVIYAAWKLGAKFDAWHEYFNYDIWLEAFDQCDLTPDFYTHRHRELDETLPWDHIQSTVRKSYLIEDFKMSQRGKIRLDCRENCYGCGILPTFSELRSQYPDADWKCPVLKPNRNITTA